MPPLIEVADTEPFFHNHSAATLEDAVRFYTTDKFVGGPLPLSEADVLNVTAFLRVLKAAFNSAISIQRNTAALTLEMNSSPGTKKRSTCSWPSRTARPCTAPVWTLRSGRGIFCSDRSAAPLNLSRRLVYRCG